MKHAITVLDMRGFTSISEVLAQDMERVGLTTDRVRAGQIHLVNAIIESCRETVPITRATHLGGDSWFIESATLPEAVKFGTLLLRTFDSKATQGFYFLKPSVATGYGELNLVDGKYIDGTSLATYTAADKGKPFRYALVGEAADLSKQYAWIVQSTETAADKPLQTANWRVSWPDPEFVLQPLELSLPTLLLDGDVLYSSSAAEALRVLEQHQAAASVVHVFGGPVSLNVPMYRDYVKSSLRALRDPAGPTLNVLSYIPSNEPDVGFAWMELCRRVSIEYDSRYSFRAFPIDRGQLRPFSFQIFDEDTVHLGLRAYSVQKGTPTMSSAIMFKSPRIAARFKGEFVESWRSLDDFHEERFAAIQNGLQGLSAALKKSAMLQVDNLLHEIL